MRDVGRASVPPRSSCDLPTGSVTGAGAQPDSLARPIGRAKVSAPKRPEHYSGQHARGFRRLIAALQLRRARLSFWQELPLLVILALSCALIIRTFLLQAFFIPTGSMERTLQVRDRVLVNKAVYDLRDPRRGEVIVFRGTDSWAPEIQPKPVKGIFAAVTTVVGGFVGIEPPNEKDFVKRVVGVPGDVVACCDARGQLTINGHGVREPYIYENNPLRLRRFGPVRVPNGRLFVMGDHRVVSQDSRAYLDDRWHGTIPIKQVIGQAMATVWPIDHSGVVTTSKGLASVAAAQSRSETADQAPPGAGLVADPAGVVPMAMAVPMMRRRRRKLLW